MLTLLEFKNFFFLKKKPHPPPSSAQPSNSIVYQDEKAGAMSSIFATAWYCVWSSLTAAFDLKGSAPPNQVLYTC